MTRTISLITTGLTLGLLALGGCLQPQRTAAPTPRDAAADSVRGYQARATLDPCAARTAAVASIETAPSGDSIAAIRSAEAAGVYRAPFPVPTASDSARARCDSVPAVPADSPTPPR